MRASQEWSARVLHLTSTAALPSYRSLLGALAGFAGILLIAGPFLREAAGKDSTKEIGATDAAIGLPRLFREFAMGSLLIVLGLRIGIPLKAIRLFQGDYLANFLLLFGGLLLALPSMRVRTGRAHFL